MPDFRPMRRSRQLLSQQDAEEILSRATSGVLSVLGDDGYPYGVPLSYVYHEGRIYFHGARAGHKLDAIRACAKASFCVVDQDQVVPQEYTTYFRSVIAFGRVQELTDAQEKRAALDVLAARYYPGHEEERAAAIDREFPAAAVLVFTIEHMTGKEAIELVRART